MQKLSFSNILLMVLAITDAWLLSHPNIIGRLGVLIYDYGFIATFPKALLTVGATLGLSYLVAKYVQNNMETTRAKLVLGLLLVACLLMWVSTYFKFSAGTYALTGKPFIFGNHLLVFLLVLIFGQSFLKVSSQTPKSGV